MLRQVNNINIWDLFDKKIDIETMRGFSFEVWEKVIRIEEVRLFSRHNLTISDFRCKWIRANAYGASQESIDSFNVAKEDVIMRQQMARDLMALNAYMDFEISE